MKALKIRKENNASTFWDIILVKKEGKCPNCGCGERLEYYLGYRLVLGICCLCFLFGWMVS